jgi:hypothetical protein
MNQVESNPYLEVDTILSSLEKEVRGETSEEFESQEDDTGIEDSIEEELE